MRTLAILTAAAILTGCATAPGQPRANLGIGIGPGGVRVVPTVAVPVAPGVTVAARP
ncbi:MAG: hypothetical protein ACU0BS_11955 [Hasllibacter sp.]